MDLGNAMAGLRHIGTYDTTSRAIFQSFRERCMDEKSAMSLLIIDKRLEMPSREVARPCSLDRHFPTMRSGIFVVLTILIRSSRRSSSASSIENVELTIETKSEMIF